MKKNFKLLSLFYTNDCKNIDLVSYKDFNNSNSIQVEENVNDSSSEPATFEKAIDATGFGLFNYILLILAIPATLATSLDTTTLSFVIPVAQCDLELTSLKKGSLNAITYAGMVTTQFCWGYLADTFGRKKLLVIGFSLAAFFDVCTVFATNYWALLLFKYLDGCSICGPFAVFMSYISEFHSQHFRSRIVIFTGICFSLVNIILPSVAWLVLTQNISIPIITDKLILHSWNIFLLVGAMPSIISAITICFLPESPKFLMTIGKSDEAMAVFQKIYAKNTGNPKESFPIKSLIDELAEKQQPTISVIDDKNNIDNSQQFVNKPTERKIISGFEHIKSLFMKPHLLKVLLCCSIQFITMMGLNSLRLWLPQLFTLIESYSNKHSNISASLCIMIAEGGSTKQLDNLTTPNQFTIQDCSPGIMQDSVFTNYIILGVVQGIFYMLAGTFINAIGKRRLLMILFAASTASGIMLYEAQTALHTLILSTLFLTFGSVCSTSLISLTVELVPTNLRTMTLSLLMMCGRFGALIGNLIFPILIEIGCYPPFLLLGTTSFVCGFLAFLLPRKDNRPLT